MRSVQVNIPAESGEMGILAQHVPSIEQLKPGLVEIIEESGGSKQFFCTWNQTRTDLTPAPTFLADTRRQYLVDLLLYNPIHN